MDTERVGLADPPAPAQAVTGTAAEGAGPDRPTRRSDRSPLPTARSARLVMPLAVGGSTLILRLATAATGPTDWDSVQYAAAVGRFDVTHGRPQPPGYWLYVSSGQLLHAAFGSGVVQSLVLVSALFSAAAAALTALAGSEMGGWWVGLSAGAIVASSPFAWFSGSIVATYSVDLFACSALLVLAWRARPGSLHGIAAAITLGLAAGFRQSVVQSFAVLALVAVVASTRSWRRLITTVVCGAGAVAMWFVPMALSQPGGLTAWVRATRQETAGAARLTSVLDHAPGGGTNIGTFAAYTAVALAPLALLAAAGTVVLLVRRLAPGTGPDQMPSSTGHGVGASGGGASDGGWTRPWYQSRIAVLGAAIVPPALLVSLVQFAKGGYLLAYLPAAAIGLLLPLGALVRRTDDPARFSPGWTALASIGVVAVVALGAQRFLAGEGVLPADWVSGNGRIWLEQPRYQAPYPDTLASIRAADRIDAALTSLRPQVRTGRDLVVFDTLDGGPNIYRNAGYALPDVRIALVAPQAVVYNQLHGSLYYASGRTLSVGPGGSVLLVASPALPGLARLTAAGSALPVTTPQRIGGYLVWRLPPGVSVLGVAVTETARAPALGTGI